MSTERFYQDSPVKTDTAATGTGAVSVTTSNTAIVAANRNRVEVQLQNDHATQAVYLSLGGTAVANTGFRLLPAAANTFRTSAYTGAISGISVGGTSVVLVTEV